ncbi:unnamed protein product [Symbiodinium sp. CCMP2592]|nr:unnamed protein product [Symbiodinium sp. CCMP2592]
MANTDSANARVAASRPDEAGTHSGKLERVFFAVITDEDWNRLSNVIFVDGEDGAETELVLYDTVAEAIWALHKKKARGLNLHLSNPTMPKKKIRRAEPLSPYVSRDDTSTEAAAESPDMDRLVDLTRSYRVWRFRCADVQTAIQQSLLDYSTAPVIKGVKGCKARLPLWPLHPLFQIQCFRTVLHTTVEDRDKVLMRPSLLTFYRPEDDVVVGKVAKVLILDTYGSLAGTENHMIFLGESSTAAFLTWLVQETPKTDVTLCVHKLPDLKTGLSYTGAIYSRIADFWSHDGALDVEGKIEVKLAFVLAETHASLADLIKETTGVLRVQEIQKLKHQISKKKLELATLQRTLAGLQDPQEQRPDGPTGARRCTAEAMGC